MADIIKPAYSAVVSPSLSKKSGEYSSDPVSVGHGIDCSVGGSEINYPKSEQESTPATFLQV